MIQYITWQQYWVAIISMTAAYYLIIVLFFFRYGCKRLVKVRTQPVVEEVQTHPFHEAGRDHLFPLRTDTRHADISPVISSEEEYALHAVMDELNAFFEEAKKKKPVRGELLSSIRLIISKYPLVKNDQSKASVSKIINMLCLQNCAVHLSAAELVGVWFQGE